jgi:hypothetical protein
MAIETVLERLAASGIDLLPLTAIETHYVFHRDGFATLVEKTGDGFGAAGSAGLLTEKGFAALVQSGGESFFVAKGYRRQASPAEVDRLRAFAADLEIALGH